VYGRTARVNFGTPKLGFSTDTGHFHSPVNHLIFNAFAKYGRDIFRRGPGSFPLRLIPGNARNSEDIMTQKLNPETLDLLIICRALHNAAGQIKVDFSEFTVTWNDSKTNKKVDFTGTIDSRISLKSAQIRGGSIVYELKNLLSDAELKGFNYLINAEHIGRAHLRSAA